MEKMNKLQKLHDHYNKYSHIPHIHLSYSYDNQKNEWKFQGYRCMKCGTILKRESTIPGHQTSCKGIIHQRQGVKIEGKIVDVNGKEWKPLEINQK